MLFKRSIIILFFFPFFSFSQTDYVFQHLSAEDGLLSNPHLNIFQDSEGFYWFSTLSGLQRFDGKNFITYFFSNDATKNRTADWAGKPIEDAEKNIWILNADGINIYNRIHKIFNRLYISDAQDNNNNNVTAILKGPQNEIRVITNKNIFQYNYSLQKLVLINNILKDSLSGIVTATADYSKKKIWLLISRNGLYDIGCFDYAENNIRYLDNPAVKKLLSNYKEVAFFKLDGSGNIWFSDYWGSLDKYNIDTKALTHYSILIERSSKKTLPNYASINDLIDDGNGTVWFGGQSTGLLKYDKKTESLTNIQYQNGSEYGLHYDQDIFSFFEDQEGNIWIDTDLGINIFNPRLQQFKYFNQNPGEPSSHFNTNITSIFESKAKDIYISTWGSGIFKYDSNFILQNNYVYNKNNPNSFGEPFNRAWSFSEDDKGKIWVGAQYGMLSILDPATGKFENKIIPEFEHFTIMKMAADKKNNLWFGLYNGMLGRWDMALGKMSVFKNLYGNSFKEPTVIDGLMVDSINVWIGTSSYGLNGFNQDKLIVDEKAISSQHIFSPLALNDSIITGGTSGKGFFLYNKFSKETKFYNINNGLSSNISYGGIPDNSNNIWVVASNEIERINLLDNTILHYNLNDGIKDHVFSKAFCKLKNGLLMVSANSGIIYFNPDHVTIKQPPPNVVITDFSADQQHLSVDSLLRNKDIYLSHTQNVVAIEYASVSFIGKNTDQYFYQLYGTDRDWVSAGKRRSVTYANLAPGNYVFKVKARNTDGIETAQTTLLKFTIYPPWWKTWWAYLLWFIIVSAIVYAVYIYRKRGRLVLANMRQRIANDLHDDIGSTLNSISVYSEIASRELETNSENTKSLLEKMGIASRNMIDTMNDIVWMVNPKNDDFENILQRMQFFAGELLSGKNILLQFDVDEKVKSIKVPMGKRKNFYLIFKEAINNIYKYANGKTVNVIITQQAQKVVMIITDDGKGFDTANNISEGNGLKNMQTRASEIHAQLSITSWIKKGTRIELRVPFQ